MDLLSNLIDSREALSPAAIAKAAEAVNRIAFDDGCMGAKLKLASPMNISMAND